MFPQTVTPGYVVEINSTTEETYSTSCVFLHPLLLTARHQAFQYVQQRVKRKRADERLEANIFLAELYENQIVSTHIARVFSQRFDDSFRDPAVFADTSKYEDPNRALAHEQFISPLAIWKSLSEMTGEYELYTAYKHPLRTGSVKLNLCESGACSDTSAFNPASKIRTPLPYGSFRLLHECLDYAVSLIKRYNHYYGESQGIIRFTISDLSHVQA